jgi:hypothetical protein
MSCTLGLWIGECFAELRSVQEGSSETHLRWFLPRKSLADGLRDALAAVPLAEATGNLNIAVSGFDRGQNRRSVDAQSVAFLVTAGFESWLRATAPVTGPKFSWQPVRATLPIDEDQIFGISERITAKGEIQTALKLDELEFLVAKLNLLKVKDIAIGFLNSSANAAHENHAANYLREKGFRVIVSHEVARTADESTHWRRTIELACTESRLSEIREQIQTTLETSGAASRWNAQVVGTQGQIPLADMTAAKICSGAERVLKSASQSRFTLHFGLERFLLIDKQKNMISQLSVQPTRQIGLSALGFPSLIEEDRGYEPGPMLFGKSHQLTYLDLLSVRERLTAHIEGFHSMISERSRPRILESLLTLGKLIPEKRSTMIDGLEVANDLDLLCLEKIATTLGCAGVEGEVALAGALSESFAKPLKERLPHLRFSREIESSWSLSSAVLELPPKKEQKA